MNGSAPLRVTDPAAAELLCDSDLVVLVKPFMRQALSVSEAALALGLSVGKMYYHVQRLIEMGLLEVTEVRPRRGRALKRYRTTAPVFYVPASLLSDQAAAGLLEDRAWNRELQAFLIRSAPRLEDMMVFLDDLGALHLTPVRAGAEELPQGALRFRSSALELSETDARAFSQEFRELCARYEHRKGPQRYGLRIDLLPLERPVEAATGSDGLEI